MKIKRTNRLTREELLVDESIFALQNGLIGVRGNFSEGYGINDYKQTLINGFYNFYPYSYEENSPEFPQMGQRIINVFDGQTVEFYYNESPINQSTCKLENLTREIDLKKGSTIRKATYITKDKHRFNIEEKRLVSFAQKELYAVKITINSEDYEGPLKIISKLDLPSESFVDKSDPRFHLATEQQLIIEEKTADDLGVYIKANTTTSNLSLGVGMTHSEEMIYYYSEHGFEGFIDIEIKPNKPFELVKFVAYTPSILHEDVLTSNINILHGAMEQGYEFFKAAQKEHLKSFWEHADVTILGDERSNQMVQYNMFQLYSAANSDPHFNIPAKGLTGEGYEGHYFWDTEIYMIPFFTITNPEIAKNLLLYRYNHLEEAKMEALKLGSKKGAKIPWRTINGSEVSPYFLAGSAQYHINSDVAYALIKYYQFTNDFDFMVDYGFELLLETGRFLLESGNYHQGRFHINGVTGPDEYTTQVNNNYYTNSMAKFQFEFLVDFYRKHKGKLIRTINKCLTGDEEMEEFALAATKMSFLFDSKTGVFAQDDSFLQKPELDIESLPKEKFPLLLHYHPMFIYKHQVLKQADVLLSMFLLDFESEELFEKNFDFYLMRTTHDSSLSKCIHAIAAFRLNKLDLGFSYLSDILGMDLDNLNRNTHHGLHIANSGGIYLAILFGLIGLRIKPNGILIRPRLPKQFSGIKTKFNYRGTEIEISMEEKIKIAVSSPIDLGIYTDIISIEKEYQCDYKS
ncbi:MAG: glycoside hydrolase family 65 protein [Bacilli bacterium]|nr:glycoside hydrolase family 65 protein [Bacilli bacterium]MBN2876216.1 glycoside hydrolase family 65 protein [Bacilli bacterium]